jgi:hypothetical protein
MKIDDRDKKIGTLKNRDSSLILEKKRTVPFSQFPDFV